MTSIFAVDPGPEQSGWCLFEDGQLTGSGVQENEKLLEELEWLGRRAGKTLAIEMIASYGMPVGREVFETCLWIGRFMQAWRFIPAVRLVYRKDVKLYLCGTTKAKDSNIRQAIIDLFPATGGGKVPQIGIKAKPGPLYGVSTHAWPAIGVALTALNQMEQDA